jgi:hypothetical protein
MKVGPAAGPAKHDRVFAQQLGPRRHDRVVVLVAGTNGGAGGITPVARDIVAHVPRTQVWIVDRREQAFEDTSVFAGGAPTGLRLLHGRQIDVPLYAYGTSLTRGRVSRSAKRLERMSRIEEFEIVTDNGTSHLDPLSAVPGRNDFLKTVVPFLRRLAR